MDPTDKNNELRGRDTLEQSASATAAPEGANSGLEDAGVDSEGVRLADFSVRYPVTICMVFVLFFTLGLISLFRIPLVLVPDVDQPFLFVNVAYPNATPAQILESIVKPLEEVLSTVPGAQRMNSGAGSSRAWVELFFDWSEDIDLIRAEVREKIDQVRGELPEDVEHISIRNFSSDDIPILFGRIASQRDLRSASDFVELKFKKPLERIPGVAEVNVWGVQRREIDIYLRLEDVKRYRVNVGQLFQRLDALNVNRSLGRVEDGGTRYSAISQGSLASLQDIENIPVNDRGLRLREIADIVYDHPPVTSGNRLNGDYAVGLEIRKTSEANTVETVNRVIEKVEEMGRDPSLAGIRLVPWLNGGEEITKSLSGLLAAGTVGALLAILVLIFFLRKFAATLIVALAIPFSIITAVGFLYLAGRTLNVMTMLGLMLATGMLVDNAVVVLESIYQKLEKGMDRVTAARVGTQEVITAVVAATLTSIIIFVPLVFGEKSSYSVWLGHTGLAIIFALLCSLFISLTLIPLAMARLLRMDVTERSPWQQRMIDRLAPVFLRIGQAVFRRRKGAHADPAVSSLSAGSAGGVTGVYLKMVSWPLRHRVLVGLILVPLATAGSVWLLMKKVPNMTPEALDLRDVRIEYKFSENFHYAKIEQDYVVPVERFLTEKKERFKIGDIHSSFGNNWANTQIYFDKERVTYADLDGIREQITEGLPVIPGAEITLGSQRGAENRTWISANLYGDDPQTLHQLAAEAKRRLVAKPDFTDVHTALDSAEEEVQIRLDRELAAKFGISAQTVSDVLGIVVRGRQVRGYRTPEGEVDIVVQLRPEDRESLDNLRSMVVHSDNQGRPVLLTQVADLRIQRVPANIRRENRRTSTSISAVYSGQQREVGKQVMSDVMDLLDYPPGYGWSFSFWTQRQDQDNKDFLFNIALALFMVYFVMASLFESLAHPFAIMFSLPFALVGVALFLYFTDTPFNPMAWIGSMVLIGIVVNNGIVLIDHINNLRRKGIPRSQAVLEGCRERLRPIVMTAGTTVVGLIPLAYGDSTVLDLKYFPMARTVMGGLVASTMLTLVVLPTYYTLLDDLANWVKRIWQESDPSRLQKAGDPRGLFSGS